jgi:predicted  nucleic acid-binding Zn-ribbon protein
MSEKLNQLENKIQETESRFSALKAELKDATARYGDAQREQRAAIIEGNDASELGAEINSLKAQINGTREALVFIGKENEALNADLQREKNALALARAEQAFTEGMEISKSIYARLNDILSDAEKINQKHAEYIRALSSVNKELPNSRPGTLKQVFAVIAKPTLDIVNKFPPVVSGKSRN